MCGSALEAELGAMMSSIALAQEWTSLPLLVESDSSEAVRLVNQCVEDRSLLSFLVQKIKRLLLNYQRTSVALIKREQNSVADVLASLGRSLLCTQVWPLLGPVDILAQCQRDCNDRI